MRPIHFLSVFLFMLPVVLPTVARPCTRVVYKGPEQNILTGRTMDFSMEIPANLWIFPRGMERNGEVGPNSVEWTSKYGSVIASSWEIATTDGMNEKGLVANLLWLAVSEYPPFEKGGDTPGIAISLWAQYALDNFATVAEAVAAFEKEEFAVVTDFIPGTDKFTTVHLSLSDSSGDNAIFEYIDGKLVIHHDPSYIVMTNDPVYEEQLANQKYWQDVPANSFLPGTNRSSDRFVRAHHYIRHVTQTDDPVISVAAVFSVIRNVSVPYGISIEGHPNLSTTRWRVVADQKRLRYFFETALSPAIVWVNLRQIDFREGSGARVLKLSEGQIRGGDVTEEFEPSAPFRFQGL
ncbi:MAG: linear amide C-N hydrolase [Verrucomicrobia bacterium]|nr:linear amide C-N hydrolase [Verrucomicrobiota bacterium]MCH8510242.1 linear amide C-N hydrolase [Kiritimatiellia bacterium]